MAVLFVTGTSGVGKDFVADRLLQRIAALRVVSWDKVFNDIKSKFPASKEHPGYGWIHQKSKTIDFLSLYQKIVLPQVASGQHIVVQGYQVIYPEFMNPMCSLLKVQPGSSLILGIDITPEALLGQRLASEKTYHKDHAPADQCRKDLKRHAQTFNDSHYPWPCPFRIARTKEDALRIAVDFFSTEFRVERLPPFNVTSKLDVNGTHQGK